MVGPGGAELQPHPGNFDLTEDDVIEMARSLNLHGPSVLHFLELWYPDFVASKMDVALGWSKHALLIADREMYMTQVLEHARREACRGNQTLCWSPGDPPWRGIRYDTHIVDGGLPSMGPLDLSSDLAQRVWRSVVEINRLKVIADRTAPPSGWGRVAGKGQGKPQGKPPGKSEGGRCFLCGAVGHMARDCPTPNAGTGRFSGEKCYRCQQYGHISTYCHNEPVGKGKGVPGPSSGKGQPRPSRAPGV